MFDHNTDTISVSALKPTADLTEPTSGSSLQFLIPLLQAPGSHK